MKPFAHLLLAVAVLLCCKVSLNADDFPSNWKQNYSQPTSNSSGSTTNVDNAISDRVKTALSNAPNLSTDAKNIIPSVTDSNVTLFGKVKNNDERTTVVRLVNRVQGVNRVVDRLTVSSEGN